MKLKDLISSVSAASLLAAILATNINAVAAKPKGNNNGAITPEMLGSMRASFGNDPSTKALRNAMAGNSIDKLAYNYDNCNNFDTHFSHRVPSKGITNQEQSGRCWLFTGLNVLRSQIMNQHDMGELKLSHSYNFFYDQLEKANLFLEGIIEYANRDMSDETVDWLFKNPLADGGQYTGVSENIMKYGIVPKEVMGESFSTNNTTRINQLISLRLREDGLELRKMYADKAGSAAIQKRKGEMLNEVYRMLALAIGQPPTSFTWTYRNSKGDVVDTREYTPVEFYNRFAGNDLRNDYVMLMNDPSRDFYKLYEIDLDRHSYDGKNWTYINLPIEDIKKMAIKSIKDSTMMYFSCDVGKFLDRERSVLDVNNFDYESLLGTKFTMNKADRIRTHASASSHAMTLVAVDLDENEQPIKWLVENSWGETANQGHIIITDEWMDEYMFRLVVDKKYVPENILPILNQKPVKLPAWDPLY